MKVRAIIPAAGLGSRMNMKPNESKEMLHDPVINGPVIQYSLNLCQKYDLDPLVVTRKEKKDLIKYCKKNKIEVLVIEPEGEWANTILLAYSKWNNYNILLLPDVRFKPESIISEIKVGLSLGAETVIGLHHVDDSSKWCMIDQNYQIIEKPHHPLTGAAMGVIGFTKYSGSNIFSHLRYQAYPFKLKNASFSYLTDFVDITRTGKIEKYKINNS